MALRCTYCTTLKGLILITVFSVLTLGVYLKINITPSKFRSKDENSSILFNLISSASTLVSNSSGLSNNSSSISSKSTSVTNASNLSNNPISSNSTLVTNGFSVPNNPISSKSIPVPNGLSVPNNPISSKSTLVTNGFNVPNNLISSKSIPVPNGLSVPNNPISSKSIPVPNGLSVPNNPISSKSIPVPNGLGVPNNPISSKSIPVPNGLSVPNNPISSKSIPVPNGLGVPNNPISSKSIPVPNGLSVPNNPISSKSIPVPNGLGVPNNPISSKSIPVPNGLSVPNNPISSKSIPVPNGLGVPNNPISSKSTPVPNDLSVPNNLISSKSTLVTNGVSVPNNPISSNSILVANDSTLLFKDGKHKCKNVLPSMLSGTWLKRNLTDSEKAEIDLFLLKARNGHSLPRTLERPDRKCGNVTFDSLKHGFASVMWFRALCDPKGDKPCCNNGACIAASEEQCRCENCYDMRQPVHAEYSKWIPSSSDCQPREFNHTEVCHLLKGATLHFVGDSFIRHIYTGLLLIMRNDFQYGGLKMNAPPAVKSECKGISMFTEKVCRVWTDTNVSVCDGTVHATWHFQHRSTDGFNYINQARSLSTTNRSMLILGIGIHENYNPATTINNVLNPLLTHMKMTRQVWPKILWASPHAPGLLKTPRIPQQNYQSVLSYNKIVNSYLERRGVPVFDTFQLTDGMMSFDGAHYGFGVNDMKARILLNYIQELSDKMMW